MLDRAAGEGRADEGSTWGHQPDHAGSDPSRPPFHEDLDAAEVISQRDAPMGRGPPLASSRGTVKM